MRQSGTTRDLGTRAGATAVSLEGIGEAADVAGGSTGSDMRQHSVLWQNGVIVAA
jgi:hypothetical protein